MFGATKTRSLWKIMVINLVSLVVSAIAEWLTGKVVDRFPEPAVA